MSGPATAQPVRHRAPVERQWRRRLLLLATALVAGAALVAAVIYLVGPEDYPGEGQGVVVVRIEPGDSTSAIGDMLLGRGVVASRAAFVEAASEQPDIQRVQPGFYQMRELMSGDAAAGTLLDPDARVGFMDVKGGIQLDDTRAPNGAVTPGVLSQISAATCVGEGSGRRCLGVDALRTTMAKTAPAQLGVPEWARAGFSAAAPNRRLEGLIAPGTYDIDPTGGPVQVLRSVLSDSVPRLESAGLGGEGSYETLIRASLVEREAIAEDMPRVARVISNRLVAGQRLELDSTVNYPLDVQALRTTSQARGTPGPYNSYLNTGLPPTPVSSVSVAATSAALEPAPGPWLFFVRCTTRGGSCFAVTFPEHQANVARARDAGAF
ncbi:endolytic transglycosylase MltG [Pseudonocardia sp. KRD291]|uniref:endolytic transglycosylase MltG n=1 Tax=Pseudonocardia sp. KRD291 TaxID=2792007 RepID=UPI001C4A62B6|nr:endolytic transglycosylase MltG [Pseudonocardia sp. KRD291]MBW0106369.1 endolytic transglycosylase MltG [Pseudonocardia sp. KRD291]